MQDQSINQPPDTGVNVPGVTPTPPPSTPVSDGVPGVTPTPPPSTPPSSTGGESPQ